MASIDRCVDKHGRLNVNGLYEAAQDRIEKEESEQAKAFSDYLNEVRKPNKQLEDFLNKTAASVQEDKRKQTAQEEEEQAAAFRQYLNEATAPDKQLQVLLAKEVLGEESKKVAAGEGKRNKGKARQQKQLKRRA